MPTEAFVAPAKPIAGPQYRLDLIRAGLAPVQANSTVAACSEHKREPTADDLPTSDAPCGSEGETARAEGVAAFEAVDPDVSSSTDDELEALLKAELGSPPCNSDLAGSEDAGRSRAFRERTGEPGSDDSQRTLRDKSIAYALSEVQADVAEAQAKVAQPVNGTPASRTCNVTAEALNADQELAWFRQAISASSQPPPNARATRTDQQPLRITSGRKAAFEAIRDGRPPTNEGKDASRRRGPRGSTRAVTALRRVVENDPRYRHAREIGEKMKRLFDEAIAGGDQSKIALTYDALSESHLVQEDFHLTHLSSIADRIERCGQQGAFACGSYWCSNCKKRFGARLLEDTQAR